jgi:hypothetical protein
MRKKIEINAVYDTDLEQVLRQLGMLDALIEGKINCYICKRTVDLDNLGAIFPSENEIKILCDNDKCIRIVTTKGVSS